MIKVEIDKDQCIGCGSCSSMVPDVFELVDVDGSMKAQVKEGVDLEKNKEAIISARDACAPQAIIVDGEVEEDEGGDEVLGEKSQAL